MVFLTIRRIRYAGIVVGAGCILVGLLLLLLIPLDWRVRHLQVYASLVSLPVAGIATMVFTRGRGAASVIEEAKMAGYEASEEEKSREEDRLREMGTLYLLIPLAYTSAWLALLCFAVEPSGILAVEGVIQFCIMFTWSMPMLVILFFAIPYSNWRRYAELNVLTHKSIEGATIRRRMRKLGEKSLGDLRILKEDESKKGKEN